MTRIEKMQAIAMENEVKASIKEVGGNIFASINGATFKVNGFASFQAKCKELKGYVAPKPVDLTARLTKLEEKFIRSL
jgi:hypothetical protein